MGRGLEQETASLSNSNGLVLQRRLDTSPDLSVDFEA
jgi:hypothetical protein